MRRWILVWLFLACLPPAFAADARFDLVGPRIDVRVTRGTGAGQQTLPIASVPNLQPGDKLWLHPDLPSSQSVKYLLICAFLRGTTNPPPDSWFSRIETWRKDVRDEGVFITVPPEAQQAVLFLAPETGGDFSTLKSAVRGRPGIFVRAAQDLNEAGYEQARIERYIADIRRVPPSDTSELQHHSDLLARTLSLKPNTDCFKRPLDAQFTCLTQTGTQTLLDDGHGQNMASALANGPTSDLIQATSYTSIAGAGLYSAYVGAIVDLVRLLGNLHTAQYQYIPAIAFPQGDALNLRLNTPPSFHNPKSVLVVGLPMVQAVSLPPLRPAEANEVACLLKPRVVLPIEGAPLVFSTDFATGLVLHLNTPPGAAHQPDIPLVADAYEGGLVLQHVPEHHIPLRDSRPLVNAPAGSSPTPSSSPASAGKPQPEPVSITGTIQGHWGFDTFVGPTVPLQQRPGGDWHILSSDGSNGEIIAGKTAQLLLDSTGSACVHTVAVQYTNTQNPENLQFREAGRQEQKNLLALSLPEGRRISPGNLHIEIQQYGQPKPDAVAAQTFADPPRLDKVALPASDRSMLVSGTNLASIARITVGDFVFKPVPSSSTSDSGDVASSDGTSTLRLSMPPDAAQPPTRSGDKLTAQMTLNDGRRLPLPLTVLAPRPSVSVISKNYDALPGSVILLTSADDLPLSAHLTFTLKSRVDFPRNGRIEIETSDGTLRTVLTLAPSGGLVLQDPHTVVASLDPLRSFGPSAFGALRLRAVFPPPATRNKHTDATEPPPGSATAESAAQPQNQNQTQTAELAPSLEDPTRESDWMPLGTLVRLPVLTHLQCTGEPGTSCNLSGSNLFLLQAISADPGFSTADPVPDGFTGNSLSVPRPASSAGTLFIKLRDNPSAINAMTVPTSAVTTQASTSHTHASSAPHN